MAPLPFLGFCLLYLESQYTVQIAFPVHREFEKMIHIFLFFIFPFLLSFPYSKAPCLDSKNAFLANSFAVQLGGNHLPWKPTWRKPFLQANRDLHSWQKCLHCCKVDPFLLAPETHPPAEGSLTHGPCYCQRPQVPEINEAAFGHH